MINCPGATLTAKLTNAMLKFFSLPLSGRIPSNRAIATLVKLYGYRLERRWPFLVKAAEEELNLGFDDLLEFQYARTRNFVAVAVGAFDGVTNDPTSQFIQRHHCRGIFVEPQPGPFKRLQGNLRSFIDVTLVNAAIDEVSGTREIFYLRSGIADLPAWTEQLASFHREHLLKHEDQVPGLSSHIATLTVKTLSFDDLIDQYSLDSIHVLQIDAEGMDAQLLAWFPFKRMKPAILHYETDHMSPDEMQSVRQRLVDLGYTVRQSDSPTDDMAILL